MKKKARKPRDLNRTWLKARCDSWAPRPIRSVLIDTGAAGPSDLITLRAWLDRAIAWVEEGK